MSGDDIYQAEILARAKAGAADTRLEPHDARATVDNPLCGDRVTLDLRLDGARIAEAGQRTRGCALCQASAETLRRCVPGLDRATAAQGRVALRAYLADGAALPPAWRDWEAFAPVRGHPSRHGCVTLPLDALAEAVSAPAQG